MSDDSSRIGRIVSLLHSWPDSRRKPDIYKQAELLADELLDRPQSVLGLLSALLEARLADNTIAQDLVSFVAYADLPLVARKALEVLDQGKQSGAEDVLNHVALQRPELAREWASGMPDLDNRQNAMERGWPTLHLIFEKGAMAQPFPRFGMRDRHPTWRLPSEPPRYRFGGAGSSLCPSCDQAAIHLLTLDGEIMGRFGARTPVVLDTCPTCWSPCYYHHDDNGIPTRIEPIDEEGFRCSNVPLVEQTVRLAETPARWRLQSWASSNSRQNLSRLGGFPSWIQADETPLVPGTKRKMKLLLQLDSEFENMEGNPLLWGSGGLLYVFWDPDTRTSCHFGQWT